MTPQRNVVRVKGFLKNYQWGQVNGLSEFTTEVSQQPQAELWFGNHRAGASINLETGLPVEVEPAAPLLVKLLSIAKPLSIQVHPDEKFAQLNFKKLTLSDPNGKDEILLALAPVWAFAGVKSAIARNEILNFLQVTTQRDSLADQFRAVFELPEELVIEKIKLLKEFIALSKNPLLSEVFEVLTENYPSDPGVLIASLLEFHDLQPGEALHVPPGCPHEYISGLALEVMTNSDNVFRMGLTVKPIDIENSLMILQDIKAEKFSAAECYRPRANFEILNIENRQVSLAKSPYRVVLALTGETTAEVDAFTYRLNPGEALLVTDHTSLEISADGRAIVADLVKDGRL
jgi:mannose-6-phosphate isomerase